MNKSNEPTVTLEECLQEFSTKSQLKTLEEEYAQRKADVESLRSLEQNLLENIIRLSSSLGQLCELTGKLVQTRMAMDQKQA